MSAIPPHGRCSQSCNCSACPATRTWTTPKPRRSARRGSASTTLASSKTEREGAISPLTEIKSENSINRVTGVATNPRQTERVAAGVRFAFRATVKVLDQDEDLVAELLKGMRLFELDSLGGSGSRGYGKIRFLELRQDETDIQAAFKSIDPFAPAPGVAA